MTRHFLNSAKPKSMTKEAKSIIQNEMKKYYADDIQNRKYGEDFIMNMKMDIDACPDCRDLNDWNKAKQLVNDGNFACYYSEQREMLNKIYGKENVDNWTGEKIHHTYSNLIGREYSSLLSRRKRKK